MGGLLDGRRRVDMLTAVPGAFRSPRLQAGVDELDIALDLRRTNPATTPSSTSAAIAPQLRFVMPHGLRAKKLSASNSCVHFCILGERRAPDQATALRSRAPLEPDDRRAQFCERRTARVGPRWHGEVLTGIARAAVRRGPPGGPGGPLTATFRLSSAPRAMAIRDSFGRSLVTPHSCHLNLVGHHLPPPPRHHIGE